ncbi:MAG: site-specific integrase [Acidobacteria bacterium]|nr:site-specific integrase [Acidobacteriota bacterium]
MSPVLVRELRPGKWYLVVRHKGRRYVRKVSESKKRAEEIKRDLEKLIAKDGYSALAGFRAKGKTFGLTVSGYADRWIRELEKSGLKPATIASYESNVRIHIKPQFGNLPLADVTYGRVKEFINDKLEQPYEYGSRKPDERKKRSYSRDSIRIMVATLRAMLKEAVRDEIIESNPVSDLGRFYSAADRMRDEPDPFSLQDLHAVEDIAGEWAPIIMFQSRTGVRVGEAIALQWDDIDFREGTARIRRAASGNRPIGKPKSESSIRSVDLSPELIETLKIHQAELRKKWFEKGGDMPLWVFPTDKGKHHSYSNFRRAFNRLQGKLKIRRRRPHDLRHAWACHQLAAGKPITWVSAQLGHKNPQITLSIYARWVPGTDGGSRDVLDRGGSTKRQHTATGEGEGS